MKEGFVNSGSANIYFKLFESEKDTLVFLHGNGEDMTYFDNQINYFKDYYSVLAIDSRGHGKSQWGKNTLTLGLMANDIICVLDYLKLTKVNLLGFSDGANIAINIAINHSDIIDKLILVGGNLNPWGIKLKDHMSIVLAYYMAVLAAKLDKAAVINRDLLALMVKEPHIKPLSLSAIKNKTLVIAGENDLIKESHTRLIAESIKNSQLNIIKKGDHFVSYKMPDEFNKIVHDFLKS